MAATVTVKIKVVVDTAAWRQEYGTDETDAEIKTAAEGMLYDGVKHAVFGHLGHVVAVL